MIGDYFEKRGKKTRLVGTEQSPNPTPRRITVIASAAHCLGHDASQSCEIPITFFRVF